VRVRVVREELEDAVKDDAAAVVVLFAASASRHRARFERSTPIALAVPRP
jgi:hypothetical protein